METLVALVVFAILVAIPVSIVVLLVKQIRMRRRLDDLERTVAQLRGADTELPPASLQKPAEPLKGPWNQSKAKEKPAKIEPTKTQRPVKPPKEKSEQSNWLSRFGAWLRENWFYAVSALSLALAGIFLVQYGVETGLLPPAARVVAALTFGAALILFGEVVRRRFGDDEKFASAYIPSVFSGAGLVTLFGGVLAARQLYDLIGAESALFAMIVVALIGLLLGWFHGPLLAAVSLIGAYAAPFVVGGTSEDPTWLLGYFLAVAVLGLGIDTVRRWAWISILSLVGAYGSGAMLVLSAPTTESGYLIFVTVIALVSIAIPVRRIWPDHSGPMTFEIFERKDGDAWPAFPTLLGFGTVAVTSGILSFNGADSIAEFWLSVFLLSGLTLSLTLWARNARALQDATLLPALGLVWFVLAHGLDGGLAARDFAITYAQTAEADFPWVATILVALGAIISVCAALRSFASRRYSVVWAGAAAVFAPLLGIALEIGWLPAVVIGAYTWALHAVALAVLMVVLAERFARVDGEERIRTALFTLSALSCMTFACVIVLSSAALTIAIVVATIVAAALDRAFKLPPMSWFIWAGVFSVTVRLVLDPGLDWANSAPLLEMTLVYGGAAVGFVVAWIVLKPLDRPVAKLLLESAAWATAGILLSLLLLRWLEGFGEGGAQDSHWGLGLLSVIWLLLAYAQVQRFEIGGKLTEFRYLLAVFFAGHAAYRLGQALTDANPLLVPDADPVMGLPVFNTLAVAYLLPGLAMLFSALRIKPMPKLLRQVSYGLAVLLGSVWLGLMVRHFWQGAAGMYADNGVSQPELYTYTVVLLIIGAVLFYQSLARQSGLMRKAGLAVIGLAVGKVFLIDIAGLGGLIRVFSLLVLGLSLAGLAWLNRWAKLRQSPQSPEPLDH
ncbi:DUF2339 domain-containing protein [Ruegeria arenilitoris]|uniref:DUF2339 domain-containing protein n=1 Tax=Ruegeria arenilitoris TaxID=1173585 RepID=UPI0014808825|nr:DUF2339 domain-containing protein [Ruegeria arenilitoris]